MNKQFWFPPLPNSEIISALSAWNISVSSEQLTRPTPEFVLGVYTFCLEHVTGLNADELHDMVQQALSALDDASADSYQYPLARNMMYHHMKRFADAAKVTDFSTSDITNPKMDRTRHILSAFINFIRFIEGLTPYVDTVRSKSIQIIHEKEKISEQLDDTQRRLRDIRIQREKDEPQLAVLREENNTITKRLLAFREKQNAIVQTHDGLRAQKAETAEAKRRATEQVLALESSVERTKSRIVQSPERIKRNIITMSTDVQEEKRIFTANDNKARALLAKVNAVQAIEKDLISCFENLQTVEKEYYQLEAAQKDLADLREQEASKDSERNQLNLKRDRIRQQLVNAEEKLERSQRQAEGKRAQMAQTIERLRREYEEMVLERSENEKHVEEIRSEADEVERKMAEHLRKNELEINQLFGEYWKLRYDTECYMEGLSTKLSLELDK